MSSIPTSFLINEFDKKRVAAAIPIHVPEVSCHDVLKKSIYNFMPYVESIPLAFRKQCLASLVFSCVETFTIRIHNEPDKITLPQLAARLLNTRTSRGSIYKELFFMNLFDPNSIDYRRFREQFIHFKLMHYGGVISPEIINSVTQELTDIGKNLLAEGAFSSFYHIHAKNFKSIIKKKYHPISHHLIFLLGLLVYKTTATNIAESCEAEPSFTPPYSPNIGAYAKLMFSEAAIASNYHISCLQTAIFYPEFAEKLEIYESLLFKTISVSLRVWETKSIPVTPSIKTKIKELPSKIAKILNLDMTVFGSNVIVFLLISKIFDGHRYMHNEFVVPIYTGKFKKSIFVHCTLFDRNAKEYILSLAQPS